MTPKILIVEDEDRARKNMVRLMQAQGFDVLSGASATEARGLIDKNQFDVIVTDMLMEDENSGLSVLKAAKDKDDLTEIIVITAYGSIPKAVTSTKLGAFDYLEKDADDIHEVLCAKVSQSLDRKKKNFIERSRNPFRYVFDKKPSSADEYDVLILYGPEDKQHVEYISGELAKRGLKSWFDQCNLVPGWMFLEEIDRVIECFKSVAVVIGKDGNPPWDNLETRGFLQEVRARKTSIIPIILTDVNEEIAGMPVFLQQMTWADFRMKDPDPMDMLVSAIRGKRPFDA